MESAYLEWRKLALEGLFSEVQDVSEFWKEQFSLKDVSGDPKYPNLSKVVGCALALPHSNAAVERAFSQVSLIKSDLRNSMKSGSLVSLLHVKNGLHTAGILAHQLKMDENLKAALSNVDHYVTDAECQDILRQISKVRSCSVKKSSFFYNLNQDEYFHNLINISKVWLYII